MRIKFGTKGKEEEEATWKTACVNMLLKKAVGTAGENAQRIWSEKMRSRIQSEAEEGALYRQVDVRAWPEILKMLGADYGYL